MTVPCKTPDCDKPACVNVLSKEKLNGYYCKQCAEILLGEKLPKEYDTPIEFRQKRKE